MVKRFGAFGSLFGQLETHVAEPEDSGKATKNAKQNTKLTTKERNRRTGSHCASQTVFLRITGSCAMARAASM